MIWLFAGSATLSVIVQALSLVPALRRTGFHYRPRWGLRGVGLGGVSRLAMWAFYGLAISQVGFFISQGALNNATAAGQELGMSDVVRGPAAYAVAFTLFMLPHAFVTVSIITALFPRFSAAAAAGDDESLKRYFRTGLTMPLVANVPIMALVIVLAGPIVALLNPGLDPRSVEVSASVLVIMILGLVPFGIDLLCYRMFFALEDGRPTVAMQVLLTGISLLAGVITLFINPVWAIGVMAFGQTIGNVVSSGTGLTLLRRRIGSLGLSSVLVTASRIGLASAVAGLVAWAVTTVLEPILGRRDRGLLLDPAADVRLGLRDRARRARLRRHLPRARARAARPRDPGPVGDGAPAHRPLTPDEREGGPVPRVRVADRSTGLAGGPTRRSDPTLGHRTGVDVVPRGDRLAQEPVCRPRTVAVEPAQPLLGVVECRGRVAARQEAFVEAAHEQGRRDVVDGPQRDDHPGRAGREDGSGEAEQLVAARGSALARVAGAEHDEPRTQDEAGDLRGLQARAVGEQHARRLGVVAVDQTVGREVHDGRRAERRPHRLLGRVVAEEEVGPGQGRGHVGGLDPGTGQRGSGGAPPRDGVGQAHRLGVTDDESALPRGRAAGGAAVDPPDGPGAPARGVRATRLALDR